MKNVFSIFDFAEDKEIQIYLKFMQNACGEILTAKSFFLFSLKLEFPSPLPSKLYENFLQSRIAFYSS